MATRPLLLREMSEPMTIKNNRPTAKAGRLAVAGLAAVLLTGCGSSPTAGSSMGPAAPGSATTEASATAGAVTVADTWVRATDGVADPSMTAAFGMLSNRTGKPLTVVSATNSVSDRTELHEMVTENGAMVMRPVAGGITIPADGNTTLAPGGLHVMLLDLTAPIKPGDEVDITLTLDDGSTVPFTAVAKEFAGANESYSPSGGMDMRTGTSGAMDMGGAPSSHG